MRKLQDAPRWLRKLRDRAVFRAAVNIHQEGSTGAEGALPYLDVAVRAGPYCDLDGRFLMLVMMSPWFQGLLSEKATGMTATGIKASKLKQLAVPLAPLAEQKRIVAKVDSLMKLCDELEAKLRRAEDRASKLVQAVVQEMVA